MGEYLEQPLELTCWRDPGFAKYQTLKETIIAFTFSVQHLPRYCCYICSFCKDLYGTCVWGCFSDLSSNVCLQEREKYKLESPETYHYLNQSKCYKLDGVNDTEEYLATRRAMDIVGISEEEQVVLSRDATAGLNFGAIIFPVFSKQMIVFQDAIFKVVAAILHLGNIEFAKGKEIDSSVIKDEKSRFHLNMTAELLK